MKKILKFELSFKFLAMVFYVMTIFVSVLSWFFIIIEYSLVLKSFIEKIVISLAKSLTISNEYGFSISTNIDFLFSFIKKIGDNVVFS